ncbi:hypothetical protein GUJ93_ZPchr0012g20287 [Zizania palustris]|uniref:Uncharacterized protein n=1 Tax=Zizania palustris TaxID=103762 RepID=A0A8J5WHG7_ZIZPA|nr:hypothetical protein GUJ93_ZPchr0012g20287 [Zizania palustris]
MNLNPGVPYFLASPSRQSSPPSPCRSSPLNRLPSPDSTTDATAVRRARLLLQWLHSDTTKKSSRLALYPFFTAAMVTSD